MKRHPILQSLAHALIGFGRDTRTHFHRNRLVRRRSSLIQTYLATHSVRKLQLGAGPAALQGWLNSDLRPRRDTDIFLDAGKPFPFEDGTFDYVYSEHFIHFLEYPGAKAALRECWRILKPGGRIRIAEPNLWSFIKLCKEQGQRELEHIRWYVENIAPWADDRAGGFVLNNALKDERFLFDPETLRIALEKSGFAAVTQHVVGESHDEHLRGIETHGKVLGNEEYNRFETFVMEARRP